MEYREVKRKAKVGERIRVTNPIGSDLEKYVGSEFIVTYLSWNLVYAVYCDVGNADRELEVFLEDEYVVLEPIEETKEENMEVCEAMPTIDYEAENENLRRLCDYQREKHRQLLKAYVNLARYIDICEDGKIRGLEGL